MLRFIFLLVSALGVLAACGASAENAEKMLLRRVAFSDLTGWAADNHVEAFGAFFKSCGDFAVMGDGVATGKEQLLSPAVVWKRVCRKARFVKPDDETAARKFFEEEFVPMHLSSDAKEHALLTGYFEPLLNGSRTKFRPYVYPVYGKPVFPVPYTRSQIEALGYLEGKAPVIAYVDDPVRLFFLHIQGSGGIRTNCGEIIRVGYAGRNEQPYVAIGKIMVEKGLIDAKTASMQTISQWLYDHPDDMWKMMWNNPSYIFFQEMKGSGPLGTERVELTPERSLAVDSSYIPLGMPVFVETAVPGKGDAPFTLWRKLMVAQDTGRAITGPMRGDIFFGAGYAAEYSAGRMKAAGDLTVLVPHELYGKISESQ